MASTSAEGAPVTGRPPPDLPNEIFLLIVQKCPGATLKNLRLSCKTLAQMAEPYLWRKVVLVPNEQCLTGFVRALKRSKVIRHITKLTYDARFGGFYTHLRTLQPDATLSASEEEKNGGTALLDIAYQSRFASYEDIAIEVAFLTRTLRQIPNLRHVRVLEHEDIIPSAPMKVPHFYQKLCRAVKIDPDIVAWNQIPGGYGRSYTKGMLTSVFSAGNRLQSFKTKKLDGRALFGVAPMKAPSAYQQLRIFQNVMQNLLDLELSFRTDSLANTANHIEAVQALLKSSKKLKTLRLRLIDCSVDRYQYSDDEMPSDIGQILETSTGTWISRPLLPRLETLIIDACTCHGEDLIHFLKIHSATLRRLELSNVTLLGGEDRRECWVRLIKHFKTDLKLASISFSGWFSNGGRQQWFVAKDTIFAGRLKAQVEKYVVDRRIRDCPLESIAIKPNQGDVQKPSNGQEYEGDLTWTMVYSNRLGDQMDWQLTEPSFGVSPDEVSNPSSVYGDSSSSANPDTTHWDLYQEPVIVLEGDEVVVDLDEILNTAKSKKSAYSPSTSTKQLASVTSAQNSWNPAGFDFSTTKTSFG